MTFVFGVISTARVYISQCTDPERTYSSSAISRRLRDRATRVGHEPFTVSKQGKTSVALNAAALRVSI